MRILIPIEFFRRTDLTLAQPLNQLRERQVRVSKLTIVPRKTSKATRIAFPHFPARRIAASKATS